MIINSGINHIHPRFSQVWNYDDIGFEPNGNWSKVKCTYMLHISHILCNKKEVNRHHFGAICKCLYERMVSALSSQCLYKNQWSIPKISIRTYQLTGYFSTPPQYTSIVQDGTNQCLASVLYLVIHLSTSKFCFLVALTATSTTSRWISLFKTYVHNFVLKAGKSVRYKLNDNVPKANIKALYIKSNFKWNGAEGTLIKYEHRLRHLYFTPP